MVTCILSAGQKAHNGNSGTNDFLKSIVRKTRTGGLETSLYTEILNKIIAGQYAPGYRLTEEDLASAHNVSRTPIREVLFFLHKDGLVERNRNRGATVASFGPDDVEQIPEIRGALKCLPIRKAVHRLELAELVEFERRLLAANQRTSESWKQDQSDIDVALRGLFISRAGNSRLAGYLKHISLLIHSLRLIGYGNEEHALQAGEEHLGIVRALMRRDALLAERLLADHIESAKRRLLELIFQGRNRPESLLASQNEHGAVLEGVKS